jgi:hypothetical protein
MNCAMNVQHQKSIATLVVVILVILSMIGFFFVRARYASSPAGIHTSFVNAKLTDEERLFIYSVMREQIVEVALMVGIVAALWAVFAVTLWRRLVK